MGFIARFFLLVLLLSFGELWLLIQVSQSISLGLTLLLCVLTGVLGGSLVRAQGFRTWTQIQTSLGRGQAPAAEIVSGLILIVIGTLLLTPGFITDSIAFLLLIPPLRRVAARGLLTWFTRKVRIQTLNMSGRGSNPGPYQTRPNDNDQIIIETQARDLD